MRPADYLAAADPRLAPIIRRIGPYRLRRPRGVTPFAAVARAIVYQQLSGRAAGTIHARLCALADGRAPSAAWLLATPDDELRAVGLSRQKIAYLKDLATSVGDGRVPIDHLDDLSDDEVVAALTQVKGIGVWTAQMFLIFHLGRPDVLPVADLGIKKAIRKVHGLRRLPTPDRMRAIGASWAPYRSVACWYLWRSLDQGFWA